MGHVTLNTPTWGQLVIKLQKIHMINLCTKFEVSTLSRFRDSSKGVKNLKMDHVTLTTPLSGVIYHRQAGT